jgi:hypothetical protein
MSNIKDLLAEALKEAPPELAERLKTLIRYNEIQVSRDAYVRGYAQGKANGLQEGWEQGERPVYYGSDMD